MGNRFAVPETDAGMAQCMKLFELNKKDVRHLWECFLRVDKMHTGMCNLDDLFKYLKYERNGFTDTFFDLLDIEQDGEVNFSEFMRFICGYCMMDELELCKVLFYVFDPDKQGFIFVDDMKALMNICHNIKHPDTVKGIVKEEWKKLQFGADGRIEWNEFLKFHNLSPYLFKPVFRLQQEMQIQFLGESFWEGKKRHLYEKKVLADALIQKKKMKKEERKKLAKDRKLKKKMGVLKYYMCPCYRKFYDTDNATDYMTEEEKLERAKRIALARRMADLKAKNPETAAWKKFETKINPEVGGEPEYVEAKVEKIERKRGDRALTRAERKRARMEDEDLQHKFSITVNKTDV